eukprot:c12811_g1_i1.p1 GENE.c12811_g1_i1~~c12811_g1_i1.p1  ORF type:complete len:134 (-),score=15.97 c12811_g1_i1:45-446(-)
MLRSSRAITRLSRQFVTSTTVVRGGGHGHEEHESTLKYQAIGESPQSIGPQNATGNDIFGGKIHHGPHDDARQEWEIPFIVGYGGGFLLAGLGLYYAPDTSLKSWAKQEAKEKQEEKLAKQELSRFKDGKSSH